MAKDGREAPKYWMELGHAERLGVFTQYQFFTPALLYLYGRFSDGPLCDFLAEYAGDCRILHRSFERTIFRNFDAPDGDAGWGSALWAVAREHWPPLENFLLSLAFHSPGDKALIRVGAQDVRIADPLFMQRAVVVPPRVPTLDVVVLGVDSSMGCVGVDPGSSSEPLYIPRAGFYAPRPRTLRFARALFDAEDPALAVAQLEQPVCGPEPVRLQTRTLDALPPGEREAYARLIGQYRQEYAS